MQPTKEQETFRETTRAPYTPPAIEQVFSREDLEREVHYAGLVTSGFDP